MKNINIYAKYYKDNFYEFVCDVFESYKGEKYKPHYTVQLLCEYIELNIKGEIEWGIYNLPRGWGKSVIISELASAWALLREPNERIACFSKKMSEDAKDWHQASYNALTCQFTKDFINKNAVSSFNKYVLRTPENGYRRVASCLASSVGSDLTLAILDDPQGEDQITSPTKRNRLHNFFSNGLLRAIRKVDYTVLQHANDLQLTDTQKEEFELTLELEKESKENVFIPPRLIVVMQRLFPKDFCAYVEEMIKRMEEQGVSKPYTKLAIPAIHETPKLYVFPKSKEKYEVEAGEYTLSSTLTQKYILQAKAQMHSSSFQAQMQQNPVTTEGQLINGEHFNYYKQDALEKEFEKYIITTDFATSESINADYSVFAVWGITENKDLYLLDMSRIQGGGLKVDTTFENMIEKWRDGLFGTESLSRIYIENVSGSQTRIIKYQAQYGRLIEKVGRSKSKFARFLDVGGFIESKKVFLPANDVFVKGKSLNEMVRVLLDECENFREDDNEYNNDDCVDVLLDAVYVVKTLPKPRTFIFQADVDKYMEMENHFV